MKWACRWNLTIIFTATERRIKDKGTVVGSIEDDSTSLGKPYTGVFQRHRGKHHYITIEVMSHNYSLKKELFI